MSVIFADTKCDLDKSQVKKLKINLVNLELKDTLSAFKKAFQPYLDEDEDIIYLSTNFKSVKNEFNDVVRYFSNLYERRVIKYIDLNTSSASAGLIVYQAGVMYKRGCTDIEIVNFVNDFKDHIFGFLVSQNKDFLSKHCTASDKININSSSNLIMPIIFSSKDKFHALDKAQGKKKALGYIVNLISEYSLNVADYPLIITYSDDEINAEYLKKCIIDRFGEDSIVLLQKFTGLNEELFDKKAIYVAFYSKKLINKDI